MDQHRDFAMSKDLDRLAAKNDRGDAMSAVRGHDDQVAALQLCYIDDRLSSRRVLDHLRVGRERVKGLQDRKRGSFGAEPLS